MKTQARIPELDGLRGIAILMVVVWHYFLCQLPQSDSWWIQFAGRSPLNIAWSGVDLFFVLSGFLLGGILIDNRTSPNFFKTFFVRRFCRTLPPYYLVLLVFVLFVSLGWYREGRFDWLFKGAYPTWSYATFTQPWFTMTTRNFGPNWLSVGWSLAVEEHFYLVLPFVIYCCPNRSLPYLLSGLIAAVTLLRMFIVSVLPNYTLVNFFLMPCRADSLLIGVFAAWAVRNTRFAEEMTSNTRRLYWILAVFIAGASVIAYKDYPVAASFMSLFGYSWLALLFTVLLLICLFERKGPVAWLCRNPLLQQVGIISYGIYLFHQPVSGLMHGFLNRSIPKLTDLRSSGITLLAFLVTLALARLSYNFFEKPIINFSHKYRYTRDETPVASKSPVFESIGELPDSKPLA